MSNFSSYSVSHGNRKDHTGAILDDQDTRFLRSHGFGDGELIGARGFVGVDGSVELELTRETACDVVRVYDRGKRIFRIAMAGLRLRTHSGERPLTREDDVYVGHLRVVERGGRLYLVSTARSRMTRCKKRNAAKRVVVRPLAPAATPIADRAPLHRPHAGLITKWDDGLGLRVPDEIAAQVGLAEGARVEIEASDDGRIIVTRSPRHFTLDELLAGMTPEREHRLDDDDPRGGEII